MKKFALALLCIVSVAFFASCNKDSDKKAGDPTISFVEDSLYVSDGDTILSNYPFIVGIEAKSNETTKELLTSCYIRIFSEETALWDTLVENINQLQYNWTEGFSFEGEGIITIAATVTNEAGNTADCRMDLHLIYDNLTVKDIDWARAGGHVDAEDTEEMASYGLYWDSRAPFANIRCKENAVLYVFQDNTIQGMENIWETLTNEYAKRVFFATIRELVDPVDEYRNVDVNPQDKDYNDVLATIDENGGLHLIHITHAHVASTQGVGTTVTITGQVK